MVKKTAVLTETPKPLVTRVLSFSDLATVNLEVIVRLPDGSEGMIPMRTISYVEWMRLGFEIPTPQPLINGVDPVTKRPLYDYNDPGYLRDVQLANTRRMYRRLLESLRIDVPGETVEEKLNALETWDMGIVNQLDGVLSRMYSEGEARIQHRAETFLSNGTGGVSSVQDAESTESVGLLESPA